MSMRLGRALRISCCLRIWFELAEPGERIGLGYEIRVLNRHDVPCDSVLRGWQAGFKGEEGREGNVT